MSAVVSGEEVVAAGVVCARTCVGATADSATIKISVLIFISALLSTFTRPLFHTDCYGLCDGEHRDVRIPRFQLVTVPQCTSPRTRAISSTLYLHLVPGQNQFSPVPPFGASFAYQIPN